MGLWLAISWLWVPASGPHQSLESAPVQSWNWDLQSANCAQLIVGLGPGIPLEIGGDSGVVSGLGDLDMGLWHHLTEGALCADAHPLAVCGTSASLCPGVSQKRLPTSALRMIPCRYVILERLVFCFCFFTFNTWLFRERKRARMVYKSKQDGHKVSSLTELHFYVPWSKNIFDLSV